MFSKTLFAAATTALIASVEARGYTYAYCILEENPAIAPSGVSGTVKLRGLGRRSLEITSTVSGLTANQKHGFHIHAGPFENTDCSSSGGHFNPLDTKHGAAGNKLLERHVGDMELLEADASGVASYDYTDNFATLDQASPFFVGGNAMTVHELEDDLGLGGDIGSEKGGNAGARWACCNITICSKDVWDAL